MSWQPIETAPKDGTDVLLWVVDGARGWASLEVGFYEHDEWFAPDYRPIELYAYRATHWMPLPDAPT